MGVFKRVAGRLVDVRVDKWMSWDYLGDTSNRFKVLLMDIVIPRKANYSETFEEAMQRLELSEEDLKQRQKEFIKLFYFFLALSVIVILYGLFMAFKGSLITAVISFCLAMYTLTQAFRFHFWLFQVKHRKLGCTIKEWMNSKVSQEPSQDLIMKDNAHMTAKPTQHSEKRKE